MRGKKIQKNLLGLEGMKNTDIADNSFSLDESNPLISPVRITYCFIYR